MSDQRQQEGDGGAGPNAPGAGPPPPRLNPSPVKPRINILAVVVVIGLVAGAGYLGVTAVASDKRRAIDAKEKIAEQQAADARREGRSVEVQEWKDWADATCVSVNDASVAIETKMAAIADGLARTNDPQQVLVLLGDAFMMMSDFFMAWADALTAGPRPEQADADAQVTAYVAYFGDISNQTREFAGTIEGIDLTSATAQQAQDLTSQGDAIDRTVEKLPDAGDVYRGLDEAASCQDVSSRVETDV
jgi:hypothetical protein